MRRCWYNTTLTGDAALFSAFRRALKSPEVLQVWGLQTCTSIDSPRSRVLLLQGLVTIMAMSAGDSPRDLQGLGDSPSDQRERERGGTESLVGLSDNLRGDTLSDCFFSLRKKSPKSPHVYSGPEACVSSHNIQQDSSDTHTPMFYTQASTVQENCI